MLQKMAGSSLELSLHELQKKSILFRKKILKVLTEAGSGHPGGSLSAIDILTTLFFQSGKIVVKDQDKPGNLSMPLNQDRDRFILSKGHGVPALYAVLEDLKILKEGEFDKLRFLEARCQGHPDRARIPEVEVSTGSLGQGLSVAIGYALAYKMQNYKGQIFCMIGDGEMQEGQIWEAFTCAAHYKLSNLTVILDHNAAQIDGLVEDVMSLGDIENKMKAFGFQYQQIDGHNFASIAQATLKSRGEISDTQKPFFIHAKTLKGKGVSFMEKDLVGWHGVTPTPDQLKAALIELDTQLESLTQAKSQGGK